MNKNLLAAIRGYIRNGMNDYEISGATGTPVLMIEKIRKQLEKCTKNDTAVNIKVR